MVDKDCQLSLSIFTFSILKHWVFSVKKVENLLSLSILTLRILKPIFLFVFFQHNLLMVYLKIFENDLIAPKPPRFSKFTKIDCQHIFHYLFSHFAYWNHPYNAAPRDCWRLSLSILTFRILKPIFLFVFFQHNLLMVYLKIFETGFIVPKPPKLSKLKKLSPNRFSHRGIFFVCLFPATSLGRTPPSSLLYEYPAPSLPSPSSRKPPP